MNFLQLGCLWQKFLHEHGEKMKFHPHAITRLRERFPDFLSGHTNPEMLEIIRQGQPVNESLVKGHVRLEIIAEHIRFIVDIDSNEVISVLYADENPRAPIRSIKQRKWDKKHNRHKSRPRFVS